MSIEITQNQLNYFQWQRQGFDRSRIWSPQSAWNEGPGLYGTGPTLYPSLLGRYADVTFADVSAALYEHRNLYRMRAMRNSMFAVPVRLVPALFQATRSQVNRSIFPYLKRGGVTDATLARTTQRVMEAVAHESLSVAEIRKRVGKLSAPANAMFKEIISVMCKDGLLARTFTRGSWKSDLSEYTAFTNWLPDVNLKSISPSEAQIVLGREYFKSYGPATVDDFRWWSGMNAGEVSAAMGSLKNELTSLQVKGLPGDHFTLASDLDTLRKTPDAPAPNIALLPVWDPYLMAYRNRERYLAKKHFDCVFDNGGNGTSAVLLAGRIGGVWDWSEDKDTFTLKLAMFHAAPKSFWREIMKCAERFASQVREQPFKKIRLLSCSPSPLLINGSQNLFRAPLAHANGTDVRW